MELSVICWPPGHRLAPLSYINAGFKSQLWRISKRKI